MAKKPKRPAANETMLRIGTHGGARQRGQQQGAACRELARIWFKNLLRDLAEKQHAPSVNDVIRSAGERAAKWRCWMESHHSELMEEMLGIAAGLDLHEPDYLTALFSWLFPAELRCCTTVAFRDAQGNLVLGKTDDIGLGELGMNVLEITRPDEGYHHAHFHFAGTIWTTAGMNQPGLAFGMNGIPGRITGMPGLAALDALHTILPRCATVEEAIEHVQTLAVTGSGFNLVLGDAQGAMAMIEKTGTGSATLLEDGDGILVHTNHILDTNLARNNPRQSEPLASNSHRRLNRARTIVSASARNVAAMRGLLAEHQGDGAICQQGNADMHTDFAVIFVPQEKAFEFWLASDGPETAKRMSMDDIVPSSTEAS